MKGKARRIITTLGALALMINGAGVLALGAQQEKDRPKAGSGMIIEREITTGEPGRGKLLIAGPGMDGRAPGDVMTFVSSEMSFDTKIVKGASYSADSITEHVQVLTDGNRIVRKSTSSVFRDGEGRTRREQSLGAIGPWVASGEQFQTVFINDPVAGVNYVLDPRTRTARKLVLPKGEGAMHFRHVEEVRHAIGAIDQEVVVRSGAPEAIPHHGSFALKMSPPKTESLGKQTLEGVEAEGTRSTMTIAAGEIGNERPIEIVSERWYSPVLQTVIMSKHIDPRVGENVFRLTNINRAEPARSVFEVPSDYTIKEPSGEKMFRFKVEKPGETHE